MGMREEVVMGWSVRVWGCEGYKAIKVGSRKMETRWRLKLRMEERSEEGDYDMKRAMISRGMSRGMLRGMLREM